MKKSFILFFTFFSLALVYALGFVGIAYANEIQYGYLQMIVGDSATIKYLSPAGESIYNCSISTGSCTPHTPPEEKSAFTAQKYRITHGNFGLSQITLGSIGPPISYYSLYHLSDSGDSFYALVPLYVTARDVHFSDDGSALLFFLPNHNIGHYDIAQRKLTITEVSQREFPFQRISANGRYLSAYNYVNDVHRVWDLSQNSFYEFTGAPSRVEFAEDSSRIVYVDEVEGFATLYSASLPPHPGQAPQRLLQAGRFSIGSVLLQNGTIYYIANESHPLSWDLYSLELATNRKERLAQNVSYAHRIVPVGDEIAFQQIQGKHGDVVLFDPATRTRKVLSPFSPAPSGSDVSREALSIGSATAALLSPPNAHSGAKPLIIWLHGGPQRQTSLAYHPYISYAVYDDILERLAKNGAYVLKLDYTGSFGYGEDYAKALDRNIGVLDVRDTIMAAEYMRSNHRISNIYLIGNSYGGYLGPRALVERPDLFDGSISINGVFDWYSLITRIPSSPFKQRFGGPFSAATARDYFDAAINTRLFDLTDERMLVLYGRLDDTVPTWQSRDFANLARAIGKNAEIIAYDDEGHIIEKRTNLDDLCKRTTTFIGMNPDICE